uniref:Uncharacterized protein n=1 Tax=Romanomermis culicivorax TaxID=13658 RepID=A0A915L9I0_ROMCU
MLLEAKKGWRNEHIHVQEKVSDDLKNNLKSIQKKNLIASIGGFRVPYQLYSNQMHLTRLLEKILSRSVNRLLTRKILAWIT